jgi:tetratricopeptide (TPR) repeat protein
VVERSGPAVVLIQVESGGESRQGSGFVMGEDGVIVTALHLLEGAAKISVSLPDGRLFDETAVLAFDVERDLAVLLVEIQEGDDALPTIDLVDDLLVEPGDPVLIISNPLGLELTVTEGIVSAWREPKGQKLRDRTEGEAPRMLLPACRLLQISASISPGSSGGPVFNEEGDVIGVATSGVLYGMASLNFAVPADELGDLLERAEPMDLWSFRERVSRSRFELARPEYESAVLAIEQGERQEAENHLGRALLLFSGFEEALVLAGRLAMEDGQLGKAKRLFDDAISSNEESAEAWYYLGTVHDFQAKDTNSSSMLERAEEAYERALDLDPQHAGAAFALAVAYLRHGLASRAEELLLTATEEDPEMVEAHYLLGEIYLQRGLNKDAEKAFKAALWEDADHALSHFGLARIYRGAMERSDARSHWSKFLQLSKDDPSLQREREQAIEIIRRLFPDLLKR